MKTAVVVLLWLGSAGAMASTCTMNNLTRNVSVVYADPGQPVPCEVLYEKLAQGADATRQIMTLWRAQNQAGYCEARAAEFVAKLESLGWSCDAAPQSPAEEVSTANE